MGSVRAFGTSHRFWHVGRGFNIPLVSLYSLMQFARHEGKSSPVPEFKGEAMNCGLFQIIKAHGYLVIYQGE